ncbi:hypothetical protein BDV12DRAFT_205890 [Aspergillus spectabilis]
MMSCCFGSRHGDKKKRDDNAYSNNNNAQDNGESEIEEDTESNPKPQEAGDYIADREKGSLKFSLNGPTSRRMRVLGSVSIAGEPGRVEEESPSCEHPAFELYWIKEKFVRDKKPHTSDYEVVRYFECEADPKYYHVHPGTLTVQGYGKECWNHEEVYGSGLREAEKKYLCHTGRLPDTGAMELLRRLDALRSGARALDENPEYDKADLEEFVGESALREGVLGALNFFWQMVITGETARRLESGAEIRGELNGMTLQVVASLVVYDLFMQNVEVKIIDEPPMPPEKGVSPDKRIEAEAMIRLAERFVAESQLDIAAKVLKDAVTIDPANIEYRCRLCRVLCRTAELDALIGDEEDSEMRYVEATLLAEAQKGRGAIKRALQAYEQAQSVATSAFDKKAMGDKVVDARVALAQQFLAAAAVEDEVEQYEALRQIYNWNFDCLGGQLRFLSKVHEDQEEGLIAFAKSIKWPHVEEARERIGSVYTRLQAGQEKDLSANLHDWLYGMILPGRFFAYSIMTCLAVATPSLSIGVAPGTTYGLVLGDITYWPTQTVMGRVLGAIPGVRFLAGWIGPCPSVKLDLLDKTEQRARWVDVVTERVAPRLQHIDPHRDPLRFPEHDDPDSYGAEIKDHQKWLIPKPPACDKSHYTLKSINLRPTVEKETRKFATIIIFEVDQESPIKIHLRTNPAFVIPPQCHPSNPAGHAIHAHELYLYQSKIWTPDKLVDNNDFAEARLADILVINATGDGAETMARALCALRGMNAVIRKSGRPCFVCAVWAAKGLNIDILIWCD